MIELGVKQKLYIDHKTDFGVYLSDTQREMERATVYCSRRNRFHRTQRLVMR